MKKYFAGMKKVRIFVDGKMAEWSNAAVLKTVDLHGSGGSNPSLSAGERPCKNTYKVSFFLLLHHLCITRKTELVYICYKFGIYFSSVLYMYK